MRGTLSLLLLLSLLFMGCTNDLAPHTGLSGTWAADYNLPGASLVLQLSQLGTAISGTGTYTIEAGRAGTTQIGGVYTPPDITFVIRYDYGLVETYTGTVTDAQHMTGTMADSLGQGFDVSFSRR
jgi:hypothetical protein